MFTGLVQEVGRIERADRRDGELVLVVAADGLAHDPPALGESIAIDGTCLTVTAWSKTGFETLVGPETLTRTTLGGLKAGAKVNLERAMTLGDRLGGHLVSGHIDGVGAIQSRTERGPALDVTVGAPPVVVRYVVEKGSIAIDGISLTVNQVDGGSFTVSLIPHTRHATTLGDKAVGARVNLEVDVIAKYVERLCAPYRGAAGAGAPQATAVSGPLTALLYDTAEMPAQGRASSPGPGVGRDDGDKAKRGGR
jgi:riboflavin synthase